MRSKGWRFAFVTDIHVGSPRSFRFQPAWNENWKTAKEQLIALQPDFVLLGGDLTRDGSLHDFELRGIREDLETLPFPYHVVPGNMDTGNKHTSTPGPFQERDDVMLNVTSEQLDRFSEVFGPLWWNFEHKGVRFSAFCDMIAGSGLPQEESLWAWLERRQTRRKPARHVWMTHYPFFVDSICEPTGNIADGREYLQHYFNINAPERLRILDRLKASGAQLILSGHVHCRKAHHAQGIHFQIGPSTAFSQWEDRWPDGDPTLGFMYCEVLPEEMKMQFVPLARRSTALGYGPPGHPRPEERDYSLAWEQP